MNIIDTSGIRVDVASKEIAEFRSFRMLAPDELRETLLQPHLWPKPGVRVKDYVVSLYQSKIYCNASVNYSIIFSYLSITMDIKHVHLIVEVSIS